jgi:hypothetical protein
MGVSAVATAATLIAIAGCSSGGPVSRPPIVEESPLEILVPSPGSSASARIVESSDTVLQSHLLTLSGLSAGWKQSADIDTGVDSSCAAISNPAYDALPLHAEAGFTSSSSLPRLTETLAYGSTAEVDAAWTSYERAIAACDHFTMRLAGETAQLSLTPMPFPRTGGPLDARQAVTTQGRTASFYVVVIRTGNLLDAVTYADWGTPSTSQVRQFVEGASAATAGLR